MVLWLGWAGLGKLVTDHLILDWAVGDPGFALAFCAWFIIATAQSFSLMDDIPCMQESIVERRHQGRCGQCSGQKWEDQDRCHQRGDGAV